MQGTIVKALAGFYYVESDGHIYQTRARGNFRKKGQTPYVGDQVEFSAEENSEGYILSIAPRKNSLVRPPIVNIDQAVVIMSAKEPDFNANLLDRFLVLLEHKGIHPIVYISKLDLLEDMEDIHYYQGIYQAIGYDFVLSIEELLPLLTNQTTVFMGQTGVGKSTLLNILAMLDKPTAGRVYLNGMDTATIKNKDASSFRREKLGFVFQDFNLLDTLSVKDNILLPLVLSRRPLKQMMTQVEAVSHQLGIHSLLEKYPYEISGGQKQRVAVARAIITKPEILLADEPTGALDSKSSAALLDVFDAINASGQTILMVTHSTAAASRAQRVLFIKDGILYNQIFKGDKSEHQMFQEISDTLTAMASEVN